MRLPSLLLTLACLTACGHSELPSGESPISGPFAPGTPLRLTYDPGPDRTPLWAVDGSSLMYAFDVDSQPDNVLSGCVSSLPLGGGTRGTTYCERDPALVGQKLQMRPYWPARRADGAIAYVHQLWKYNAPALNPYQSELVLQPKDPAGLPTYLLPIPYFATETGRTHFGISHPVWLDGKHLLFLARNQLRSTNDNVDSGLEIVILAVDSGIAGVHVLPGTLYASSVSLGATADTIYYTMLGDSLVYRRSLSSGVTDTAYDFGVLGIARDAQVRHGKLVAIVGGLVSTRTHATFGMVQDDFGGLAYAVDLPAGVPAQLSPDTALVLHLALAPDGKSVVGQWSGDLWRMAVP